MGNFVDTVEHKIQNAILTAIENITPRIELAIRAINTSSGRDAVSVTSDSERGERIGIAVSFENSSERNSTFHDLNANDETGGNIPSELSELSDPRTNFDGQSHTRHSYRHF